MMKIVNLSNLLSIQSNLSETDEHVDFLQSRLASLPLDKKNAYHHLNKTPPLSLIFTFSKLCFYLAALLSRLCGFLIMGISLNVVGLWA